MELGFTLGARKDMPDHGYGISAFIGNRPGFEVDGAVPEADRFLVYLDGFYKITSALDVRAELMFGNDRDPLVSSGAPVFAGETDVLAEIGKVHGIVSARIDYESLPAQHGVRCDFSRNGKFTG
jgi:hypothetical protein